MKKISARGRYSKFNLIDSEKYFEFRRSAADGDQRIGQIMEEIIIEEDLASLCGLKEGEFFTMAQTNKVLSRFNKPNMVAKFFKGNPCLSKDEDPGVVGDVVESYVSFLAKNYNMIVAKRYILRNLKKEVLSIIDKRKQKYGGIKCPHCGAKNNNHVWNNVGEMCPLDKTA